MSIINEVVCPKSKECFPFSVEMQCRHRKEHEELSDCFIPRLKPKLYCPACVPCNEVAKKELEMVIMPTIGEIRHAKELGYKGNVYYRCEVCPDCGESRWVQLRGGIAKSSICAKCAIKNQKRKMHIYNLHGNGEVQPL